MWFVTSKARAHVEISWSSALPCICYSTVTAMARCHCGRQSFLRMQTELAELALTEAKNGVYQPAGNHGTQTCDANSSRL
eukprot:6484431-Amphidinium_carterae.1